LTNQKQWTRA